MSGRCSQLTVGAVQVQPYDAPPIVPDGDIHEFLARSDSGRKLVSDVTRHQARGVGRPSLELSANRTRGGNEQKRAIGKPGRSSGHRGVSQIPDRA